MPEDPPMTAAQSLRNTEFNARRNAEIVAQVREAQKAADPVNHPVHYGGADNPYEAIKVIEAWGLNFNLGNTAKYISRAGKKDATVQDLKKAAWYLQREIANLEKTK